MNDKDRDTNLEASHVSCDSPERRVHHHIVGLGHGDGYEGSLNKGGPKEKWLLEQCHSVQY